ncbi:DoxX family protein [Brevibacterium sp. XM4083]|uniref:DoxX family protein n=1 Tax=Brevibacterium sp. XM4083 TaxID=2583238 RepID=UPI00112E9667|nr:DoxX family protein [Brevibacterium sp. XM4083]MCM1011878.1 DoxX family protein [Brevibacterium sp. XM4083]
MEPSTMDWGIAGMRVIIALILFAHSTQKLCGWFSGSGPAATAGLFEKLGQRPGHVMVRVASVFELIAAVSLLFGILTPIGIGLAVATMIVAGAALSAVSGTFWNALGGGEYPFFIAAIVAMLGITGQGALSLDTVLMPSIAALYPIILPIAVVVGILGAIPMVMRTRRAIREAAASTQS